MKNLKTILAILAIGVSGSAMAQSNTENNTNPAKSPEHVQCAKANDSDDKKCMHEHKKMNKGHNHHHKQKMKHHSENMNKMWIEVDANKDGAISKAEALAVASEKFDQMDLNKDNVITKEELKEYHMKNREHRRTISEKRDKHSEKTTKPSVESDIK